MSDRAPGMRVLFATYADRSHFMAMVPLAWALRAAGHDVRVASQPALVGAITGAGLTAVPVGADHRLHQVLNRTGRMAREDPMPFDFARPAGDLTWPYLRDGYAQFVPWWCRLVNDPMVDDLVDVCRRWEPDLVVWEPVTYAGAVAATVCGAAHARMMWSVDLFARARRHFLRLRPDGDTTDPLARWLDTAARRHGARFEEPMTTGHFTVDTVPDSLRLDPSEDLDLDLDYLPMRYVPYNGTAVVEPWLRRPPQRPRVCVTLGSSGISSTQRHAAATTLADMLDALADLDIEVVATVPADQRADLGPVPANTRTVAFAPLAALVPTCAAVVHHGGNGTYCTTLVHGVPQLVLPNMFDLSVRARYLARQGAGITMAPADVSPGTVRDAVIRLVGEPSFGAHARRLRAEMLALPTPNDLVPVIESRVRKHRRT